MMARIICNCEIYEKKNTMNEKREKFKILNLKNFLFDVEL